MPVDVSVEKNLEAISSLIDELIQFAVAYGFQILGALIFLLIGLKVAGWAGNRVYKMGTGKDLDASLARFIGNIVKIVILAFVVIITLGNFGISIAPLIALAGATAFGATIALQGPLSNYGAGFAIMIGRPFAEGNTITVGKVSGVVDDITLAATVLVGEDGEKITIPNKEIVGQVIVNSRANRIVETRFALDYGEDTEKLFSLLRGVLAAEENVAAEPAPAIGIHDFTYGGVVVGLRFWVPSDQYYQVRYAVNTAILSALRREGISLMSGGTLALSPGALSADERAAAE